MLFIQTDHMQKAERAPFLCRVCPDRNETGFTAVVPAADLAAAQEEAARLRAALEDVYELAHDPAILTICREATQ